MSCSCEFKPAKSVLRCAKTNMNKVSTLTTSEQPAQIDTRCGSDQMRTLIATRLPVAATVALYTWPNDAAATGSADMPLKSADGALPRSAAMVASACSLENGGMLSCSRSMASQAGNKLLVKMKGGDQVSRCANMFMKSAAGVLAPCCPNLRQELQLCT